MGVRDSCTFPTKAQAEAWAIAREAEILAGSGGLQHDTDYTLVDAMRRYAEHVSISKKGARWEQVRLRSFERNMSFCFNRIADIKADSIARWRDKRLKTVSGSTVRRELTLLSSVFNIAQKEWRWTTENPVHEIIRPKPSRSRSRRVSSEEITLILERLNHAEAKPETLQQELAIVFLIALETAMRQGEILSLDWADVFLEDRFVHLCDTKNGSARDVPLSTRAVELFGLMQPGHGPVFRLQSGSADTLFRRAVKSQGIENLTFHDSRHEATTRLAKKLDILQLARTIGHKDLRSLMIYYNPTASELAESLD